MGEDGKAAFDERHEGPAPTNSSAGRHHAGQLRPGWPAAVRRTEVGLNPGEIGRVRGPADAGQWFSAVIVRGTAVREAVRVPPVQEASAVRRPTAGRSDAPQQAAGGRFNARIFRVQPLTTAAEQDQDGRDPDWLSHCASTAGLVSHVRTQARPPATLPGHGSEWFENSVLLAGLRRSWRWQRFRLARRSHLRGSEAGGGALLLAKAKLPATAQRPVRFDQI